MDPRWLKNERERSRNCMVFDRWLINFPQDNEYNKTYNKSLCTIVLTILNIYTIELNSVHWEHTFRKNKFEEPTFKPVEDIFCQFCSRFSHFFISASESFILLAYIHFVLICLYPPPFCIIPPFTIREIFYPPLSKTRFNPSLDGAFTE